MLIKHVYTACIDTHTSYLCMHILHSREILMKIKIDTFLENTQMIAFILAIQQLLQSQSL